MLRGGSFKQMPSQTLVPGDVIAVLPGTLPADCVLLTGECIVDENMLTGEESSYTGTACGTYWCACHGATHVPVTSAWLICPTAPCIPFAWSMNKLHHTLLAIFKWPPAVAHSVLVWHAGESVPVRKVPYNASVEGLAYNADKHSSCTLYGGTLVAQARALGGDYPDLGISPSAAAGGVALAMVVRTRFYSAKGQLLR